MPGVTGVGIEPCSARRAAIREALSDQAFEHIWNGLMEVDPSHEVLTMWIAQNGLRTRFATGRNGGQRHDVARRR